jgi:glycosyltransferase involved in cell wall biosynthesis
MQQMDEPMHILFLSHYYPPEVNAPASRTSEHCRQWVNAGHDVTVVTCVPNHPAGKLYDGYRNRLFQRETLDGVEVIRVWTYLAANAGFLRRTLNYLSYLFGATLALPRLKRPDVIISTSPQFFCGLSGLIARAWLRAPWVLEIRDIWPESIVTVGAMKKGMSVRVLEWLERSAYKRADNIVAVTDSFVPHIAERCDNPAKVNVIKNGVDLTFFTRDGNPIAAKRALGFEDRFVAAYVGTHGMAHGLDTILEAARLTADDPRILYVMVGDGAERGRLVERAHEMRLANVRILGQRPKSDMPMVWAATDASLIILRRDDLFKKVLPSKMFEAMGMARPIVLGVEGEAKELLYAAGAGLAITPESAEELAAAVRRLAAEPSLSTAFGESGAAYVREQFDRAKLAARYIDLLREAASERTRRTGNRAELRRAA